MKFYRVEASALSGHAGLPASKSQSIRAILFATMASGVSHIANYLPSPDIDAMINACRQLGAKIAQQDNQLTITGVNGSPKISGDIIDAGNSGQVLRFIACLVGLQDRSVIITGDQSLRHNRPIASLIEALSTLGIACEQLEGDAHVPLKLTGAFQGEVTTLSGEDSQPVSGLLMALGFKEGTTTIKVRHPGEKPWVELTLQWLDRFAIPYENKSFAEYKVTGKASIPAFTYHVPGDLSSLAYPLVAGLITQSEVVLNDVDMNEAQGDKAIIDALKTMGAKIDVNAKEKTLTVRPTQSLQGIAINVNDFIDSITIMAVVGCFAKGTTTITGAAIARRKESDRIVAMTMELRKMGANIEALTDGFVIQHSPLQGAVLESHKDHRVAMSLAIAAMAAQGETTIRDVHCVDKSFPRFAETMHALGGSITAHE